MKKYEGKTVTVVRPARQGDEGFDPKHGDQSLIRLEDGTQKVVPTDDVDED